ncbi:MAG TPA: HD domain-containing phosphohydrolase [Gemmatimonadaceae bacterium]|nr:HD domain-containing phosphohydrolase [Gemmatimonadaceae bacterium]
MTLKLMSNESAAVTPEAVEPAAIARIIVVDDEAAIRTALSRFLKIRGFHAVPVASGAAALEAMRHQRFEAMVCDVRMPGMTGLELITPALAQEPDLAIVMLSAVNDAVTASTALARGATAYLVKPIELADLHREVVDALARRSRILEHRRAEQAALADAARKLEVMERDRLSLEMITVDVAHSVISAMEAKSLYMKGHSERVASLAVSIALHLGLDDATVEAVRIASLLHDVGTAGVSEIVLAKAGELSSEEMNHVREHVRIGMQILSPLRYLGRALDYVCDHHEHFDGGGYPRGVAGEAISLGGRIIASADAYDALTSARPYREAVAPLAAVATIKTRAGTLFDPVVVLALDAVIAKREETRIA